MPVQPDELELRAGDRVRSRDRHEEYGYGTIARPASDWSCYVRWDKRPGSEGYEHNEHMIKICNNCDLQYHEHANNEKCIYQPTYWE